MLSLIYQGCMSVSNIQATIMQRLSSSKCTLAKLFKNLNLQLCIEARDSVWVILKKKKKSWEKLDLKSLFPLLNIALFVKHFIVLNNWLQKNMVLFAKNIGYTSTVMSLVWKISDYLCLIHLQLKFANNTWKQK